MKPSLFKQKKHFLSFTITLFLCLFNLHLSGQICAPPSTVCSNNSNWDFRQTANCSSAPYDGCSAGDVDLLDIRLIDPNQSGSCITCQPGANVTWNLEVDLSFGQNGNRSCFALAGDLFVNGVQCCVFSRVNTVTCVTGMQGSTQTIPFGMVTFTCGDELELRNVVVGWAANCNTGCTDGMYCPISSKCSNPGNLIIKTPVGATCYEVPAACTGEDGQVGVTARGGTPPYSYDWRDATNNQVGTDPEITVSPGTYSVTVTDAEMCTSSCSVTLTTTMDNEDPVISCPGMINVNNDPGACGAIVNFMATASDNCPGVTISYSHQPNTFFPVGSTIVTATATDASNRMATCMFEIFVDDNEVSAVCQNTTIQLDASGNASITPAQIDGGSSDNCNALTLSANPTSFTCTDLGTNNVTLTASDDNGNQATCMAIVMVEDNLPPTAMCVPSLMVALDATGTVNITASQVDNGSFDNCGPPTLAIVPASFDCSDVGTPVQVTLTATDQSNNQSSCTTTVTVTDPLAPTVITQNIIVQLGTNGSVGIIPNQVDDGSFDNCGIASMSVAPSTFNCTNVGSNTVTLTVIDINGNSSSNTATVTVQDNVDPIATCQDITVQLAATGGATIVAGDIDNGSTDNCAIGGMTVNPANFNCSNLGPNQVVLTVTDVNGNTATCMATVTVEDNVLPTITCHADITVDNDPGTCGAVVNYSPSFADNCSATVVCTPPSGSFFAIGTTTTVICTVTDPSNNSSQCSFTVTVNDALAPGISCPSNVTISCEDSTDPANTGTAASSDICGGTANISFSDVIAAGSCANEMVITRTWTATDANNNSTSCDQIISVIDLTPPSISCPAQINVSCESDVPPANPNSVVTSDNCAGPIAVTHLGDSQAGTNPIIITRTYQAQDVCLNTSTCTQIIVVENLTAPVLTCPGTVSVQCLTDLPAADPDDVMAQATCGGSVTVTHIGDTYTGNCPTVVIRTYQGEDVDGNIATCSQQLIIRDTMRPVITNCLPGNDFGCFTSRIPGFGDLPIATTSAIVLGAIDNCTDQANLSVSHSDIGPLIDGCIYTFERIYSVSDECGNVATCEPQIFTFRYDVTPPVFYDLPADQVYTCGESIPAIPSAPSVTDECPGGISLTLQEIVTNQSCLGEAYLRIWTATDACGNVSTFTQTASKQDLTAPEILRANDTTIICGQQIPAPYFEVIENCPESRITEEFEEEILPGGCTCEYTIRRTWYVHNSCLAEFRDTQYIYVIDTSGPSISLVNPMLEGIENGGSMVMYGCAEPQVLMNDIVVDDCCGITDVQLYDSLLAYKSCEAFEYFALWVCGYVAIDPCGNRSEFKFYVQQVDTSAPKFILPEEFIEKYDLDCNDSIPNVPDLAIYDDCDLIPLLEYRADTVGFYPDSFAIIRSWESTDDCLNADRINQTIGYCGFDPDSFVSEIGNQVWQDENGNGVQDQNEIGINGIEIHLYSDRDLDGLPDTTFHLSGMSKTREGVDGRYYFSNLEPGHYFVKAIIKEGWSITSDHMGDDAKMDSDIDPITGLSPRLEIQSGQSYLDIDIGLVKKEEVDANSIEITSFEAESQGCLVRLSWETNSSQLGHKFAVERSRDGINYQAIGTVQTSATTSVFNYEDKNSFGKVYYRLSFVGANGEKSYSSEIYLQNRCVNTSNFVLFPNPTKGDLTLQYEHGSESPLQAQIIDMYGRVISTWMIGKRLQGQAEKINLELSEGIYWLRINNDKFQTFRSIVVIK